MIRKAALLAVFFLLPLVLVLAKPHQLMQAGRRILGMQVSVHTHAPSSEPDTGAGWIKSPGNPVLGGALGTCFDITVIQDQGVFKMWFSWRPKKSIALVTSADGVHWSPPEIALEPNPQTDWEEDINRPYVLKQGALYHLWYTGQQGGRSWIGHATSADGRRWQRTGERPALSAELAWEKSAVMCPSVLWDAKRRQYQMWYSGGDQYEPDAIGYATSKDGQVWKKYASNPVFQPDPTHGWETAQSNRLPDHQTGKLLSHVLYRFCR